MGACRKSITTAIEVLRFVERLAKSGADLRPCLNPKNATVEIHETYLIVRAGQPFPARRDWHIEIPIPKAKDRFHAGHPISIAQILQAAADALEQTTAGKGRPKELQDIAENLAPLCGYLPKGDLIVEAPWGLKPAYAVLSSGLYASSEISDLAQKCPPAARINVQQQNHSILSSKRSKTAIIIKPLYGKAATGIDAMTYLRKLSSQDVQQVA